MHDRFIPLQFCLPTHRPRNFRLIGRTRHVRDAPLVHNALQFFTEAGAFTKHHQTNVLILLRPAAFRFNSSRVLHFTPEIHCMSCSLYFTLFHNDPSANQRFFASIGQKQLPRPAHLNSRYLKCHRRCNFEQVCWDY